MLTSLRGWWPALGAEGVWPGGRSPGGELFGARQGRVRPDPAVAGAVGSCRSTHVLLPDVALLQRVDAASVIGRALMDAAAGAGHRRIAARLARPASTVRGRLRSAAARIAAHFGA